MKKQFEKEDNRSRLDENLLSADKDTALDLELTAAFQQEAVCASSQHTDIGMVIENRYELLAMIGQSYAYKVYLAIDKRTKQRWAVKLLSKDQSRDKKYEMQFVIQEAEMLVTFNHPAIPRIVEMIDNPDYIAIVMDYVEGETLDDIVKKQKVLSAELVIDWAKQLCDVLGYLHSLQPPHIYRDMKPANLMLEPTGKIKLIDFGIVRKYKPNQSGDTCSLGTMGYAAPEQYGGRQSDSRTDIYGLGMTMYYLVTGMDPTKSSNVIKPICQVHPQLPKGLEYIISKCIQLNPDDRYQSCSELLADLNRYEKLPKPKGMLGKLFKRR